MPRSCTIQIRKELMIRAVFKYKRTDLRSCLGLLLAIRRCSKVSLRNHSGRRYEPVFATSRKLFHLPMYKCRASPPYEVILRLGQLIVMLPRTFRTDFGYGTPKKNCRQKHFFFEKKIFGKMLKNHWKFLLKSFKNRKFSLFRFSTFSFFLGTFRFCQDFFSILQRIFFC